MPELEKSAIEGAHGRLDIGIDTQQRVILLVIRPAGRGECIRVPLPADAARELARVVSLGVGVLDQIEGRILRPDGVQL